MCIGFISYMKLQMFVSLTDWNLKLTSHTDDDRMINV